VATTGFISETVNSILEKTLCPLVDKATADPDRVGDVRDRHTISYE
jgi:hypothetical protein